MKIYTKTGDDGTTSLFAGGRVPKTHPRVDAYGTVDELNAILGAARAHGVSERADHWLEQTQNHLFHLGADLATPAEAASDHVVRVTVEQVTWLEQSIDRMNDDLPPLKQFILPGGTAGAAMLHVARTVCRRAERCVVELSQQEVVSKQVLPYLNRLSDWLFVLARWENHQAGISEAKWSIQS
jgi:cob(I)alamin adenosyltransferase